MINIDLVILGITIEFEDGEGLFAAAESMGLEGIMAKKRGTRYVDGKRTDKIGSKSK